MAPAPSAKVSGKPAAKHSVLVKHPVFPATDEVKITDMNFRARMFKLMVDWPTVAKTIKPGSTTAEKIKLLIVAETETRNRPTMLNRLISRFHIVDRQELKKRLGL